MRFSDIIHHCPLIPSRRLLLALVGITLSVSCALADIPIQALDSPLDGSTDFSGSLGWFDRWLSTGFWADLNNLSLDATIAGEESDSTITKTINRKLFGAWGRYYFSPAVEGRFEISGYSVEGTDESLGFGQGTSGAFLLRYQPLHKPWMLQAGLSSPRGGKLSKTELTLSRLLSDPLLGMSESSSNSGWTFCLGAIAGHSLSPNLELYGGGGYELRTSYSPSEHATVSPGSRSSFLGGLKIEGLLLASLRGGLEIGISSEGEQKIENQVIRGSQGLTRFSFACGAEAGPVNLALQASMISCGMVEWASPAEADVFLEAGPGKLTVIGVELRPRRNFHVGELWILQFGLGITMRSYTPNDLPYGEGSMMVINPHLTIDRFDPLINISYGMQSGTWTDPADVTLESDISGSRIRVSLSWQEGGLSESFPARGKR